MTSFILHVPVSIPPPFTIGILLTYFHLSEASCYSDLGWVTMKFSLDSLSSILW